MTKEINYSIDILKATRENVLKFTSEFTFEQMTKIPEGFSNSILWNFGHNIVVQQLLCYKLSGVDPIIDPSIIEKFRKGASGDTVITEKEYDVLRSQYLSTVEALSSDYVKLNAGDFYTYTTSYGISLGSVDESITFNTAHETLHFGIMMSIGKLVR